MNNLSLLICACVCDSAPIVDAFRRSGYLIEKVSSSDIAFGKVMTTSPDIIISELSEKVDGLSLLKRVRATDRFTPFLMLNLMDDDKLTVVSLEAGANDCMRMPCSTSEILARAWNFINNPLVLNRSWKTIGRYTFEPVTNTLHIDGKTTVLPGRESDILEILSKCINRTVNAFDILNALWEDADYYSGRSLSVHITKLRKKLSGDPDLEIINERGVGYRLVDKSLLRNLNKS